MSQPVILKVYAHFTPVSEAFAQRIETVCQTAIADEDGCQVDYEDGLVRVAFAGLYFPVDDLVELLQELCPQGAIGKLDVLDLENWQLTRYVFDNGKLIGKSRDLNNVLDYSHL